MKSPRPPAAEEQVRVEPAPAGLRAHTVCAVIRRIASGEAVASRVQANPFACLNVITQGAVSAAGEALPRAFITGPLTQPWDTTAQPPLASCSIVLQPWTVRAFGLAPTDLADTLAPLDADLPPALPDVLHAAQEAAHSGDVPSLWLALGRVFALLTEPALALDALRQEGVMSAARACGLGERQYRRRFEAATGLRPSAWLRLDRFSRVLAGLAHAPSPLADQALAAGYADQAHLGRETRALLQATPAPLRRRLRQGPIDWALAPARVRNLQDPA